MLIILYGKKLVFLFYCCCYYVIDQNSFHPVDTIGNIFMSGAATSENITDGVQKMK